MKYGTFIRTSAGAMRFLVAGALLWTLASVAVPPPTAHAQEFIVDTTTDNPALNDCTAANNDCSLRGAISKASANPGPDTILFAGALDGLPVVLVGASGENANASGDLDILDGGDLTIQGNGTAYTTIDGGQNDRVFDVCPGGGCTNTVTLSGMTIRKGSVGGIIGSGGGVRNAGATLDILNSTIGGTAGTNAAKLGGGIYNGTGATTTLDATTISANSATSGGGIYNQGILNLQDSTVGGKGVGNSAISGGGIYNSAGVTTVDGSTVSANSASLGGGIYNQATLNVQGGSMVGEAGAGNTSTTSGGGICNMGGTSTVDGSTVSANSASLGGGIYNEATLNVQGGSMVGEASAGNTSTTNGGGICNMGGTSTVDGSTVSANSASLGGGIYNEATLNIQHGSIIGAIDAPNTATAFGGGVFSSSGSVTTVNDSTVSGNVANVGGGIYSEGTLRIQNGSTIGEPNLGNWANSLGGGIYASGTAVVDGSTVRSNTADQGGGGIYSNGTLTVRESTIGGSGGGNLATTYGGGIYNANGATTLDSTIVTANRATNGGGIYNEASLDIQNGSVIGGVGTGNTASIEGGGIYNAAGASTTIDDSSVSTNHASWGGGILNQATLDIQNGSVIGGAGAGNTASTAGGGIYGLSGTVTVDGSTVSANTSSDGAGIYNEATLIVQNGSTIGGFSLGNTATGDGGGIYIHSAGTAVVTGSRILSNTAANGGGVLSNTSFAGAVKVTGSCIAGNSDTSFHNAQSALQTAIYNWWGAASGPSGIGPGEGDSVSAGVDYGNFLTEPILGCGHHVYLPIVVLH
jgi:fibronectin-binding autotransporter adhesin